MLLVDTHAHLDFYPENEIVGVIERARNAGVKAIITSGVNKKTNRLALEFREKYKDIVKVSLGIYPLDALNHEMDSGEGNSFVRDIEKLDVDEELKFIEQNKDKIVAIGECGLDYKFIKDKQKEMKEVFQKVINTAEKIKKPLIIHSRNAEFDCVDMLESSNVKKVVMHCFQGRKHLVKRAADKGWFFSIPPVIVKLEHFQMMAEMVDMSQLLTETDAPYLSPFPGKKNEPAYVLETIKKIAEIKNMEEIEVANNVYKNYQTMFL